MNHSTTMRIHSHPPALGSIIAIIWSVIALIASLAPLTYGVYLASQQISAGEPILRVNVTSPIQSASDIVSSTLAWPFAAGMPSGLPDFLMAVLLAALWLVIWVLMFAIVGVLDAIVILVGSPYLIALVLFAVGVVILIRYIRLLIAIITLRDYKRARHTMRIDLLQIFLIAILISILFPVVWIFSMSLDPRDLSRPQGLTIIPPGATISAYLKILTQPSPNDVSFIELLKNSLMVAGGTAALAVIVGTSAAYAFSRLKFIGRKIGMLGFVLVLMIPAGATLAPLFVLLNVIGLRTTLWGLAIAYTSSALPFAIWNMKGFIDSLPYDLEEAAQIDGCSRTQGFIRVILPLAVPGMAVTALWGFLTGWSEFILAWTFLSEPSRFTLPMVLRGMIGQYAAGTPWSEFSAMSILMSIPAVLIFFFLQRYLVSGLAVGGVKG
jgi:arabinogalactan oligomer/maltooligosaccharide transport system permease protein